LFYEKPGIDERYPDYVSSYKAVYNIAGSC